MYHIRNLILADYLYYPKESIKAPDYREYVDLTPSGHEFLNTIRDPKIWKETKNFAAKAGSFSLKIVSAIAEGIARGYIQATFNIPIS